MSEPTLTPKIEVISRNTPIPLTDMFIFDPGGPYTAFGLPATMNDAWLGWGDIEDVSFLTDGKDWDLIGVTPTDHGYEFKSVYVTIIGEVQAGGALVTSSSWTNVSLIVYDDFVGTHLHFFPHYPTYFAEVSEGAGMRVAFEAGGTFVVLSDLFTASANTVNFNSLAADQEIALEYDAYRYDALGGNDVVTLPDEATVVPGGWSEASPFKGGAGDDVITGGNRDDTIHGDSGNDKLTGGRGRDNLLGGTGDDTLDTIDHHMEASATPDILTGGTGSDVFYVDHGDTVTDFTINDVIFYSSRFEIDEIAVVNDGQSTYVRAFDYLLNGQLGFTIANGVDAKFIDAEIYPGLASGILLRIDEAAVNKLSRITIDTSQSRKDLKSALDEFNSSIVEAFKQDLKALGIEVPAEAARKHLYSYLKKSLEESGQKVALKIAGKLNIPVKAAEWGAATAALTLAAIEGRFDGRPGDFFKLWVEALHEALNPFAGATSAAFGGAAKLGSAVFDSVVAEVFAAMARPIVGVFDLINGASAGDDTQLGTGQPDFFYMQGGDDVGRGRGGDDYFAGASGAGDDLYDGGPGNDEVSYSSATGKVMVNLGAGSARGAEIGVDRLVSIEDITGGAGDDTLIGNGKANAVYGGDGDDVIAGRGSEDLLVGDIGSDILRGGTGKDTLDGGRGEDTLSGGGGDDRLKAGAGADLLKGGGGNDFVAGGGGNDTLAGGGGDDRSKAGAGADLLDGGGGSDVLKGGAGDDILTGGRGKDTLQGGSGADRFVFTPGDGVDRIVDFADGVDELDLTAFDMSSVHEAKSFASNVGDNVVFDFAGGEQLIVEDMTRGQLTGADLLV